MDTLIIQDELAFHKKLSSRFPKHPSQLNKVNEADAELVFLEQGQVTMAITTDLICEEIEMGIYKDPFLIGWMAVVVNVSDLCAVGAKPKYITLNEIFNKATDQLFIEKIQEGIAAACEMFDVFVLGGDTNFSNQTLVGGTAIGFIDKTKKAIQRTGARNGDYIYTGRSLGLGNFFAMTTLQGMESGIQFKPCPDIKLSQLMSNYASSCIDTSDGLFHALYTLIKLNEIGIALHKEVVECIPGKLRKYCKELGISPLMLFAGMVGEYELVFTVPKERNSFFLKEIQNQGLTVFCIGKVTDHPGLFIVHDEQLKQIALEPIINAFEQSKGDITKYIEILKIHTEI